MTVTVSRTYDWRLRWERMLRLLSPRLNLAEVQADLDNLHGANGPEIVAFSNAHFMNLMVHDCALFEAANQVDRLYRDGSGLALLLRLLGRRPGLNLNGTDLIPLILARFRGERVALLGTRMPQLAVARDNLVREGHVIPPGCVDEGFASAQHYVDVVLRERPRVVVLGMGMPKQEQVAAAMKAKLDFPCLIICGGAIIDFIGEKVSRAPAWVRKVGLEWVYRLMQEPKRLFKRYVLGNPAFVARSIAYRLWVA